MPTPPSTEILFEDGELTLVTRTEASPFRLRQVRRTTVTLTPAEAFALAHALLLFATPALSVLPLASPDDVAARGASSP